MEGAGSLGSAATGEGSLSCLLSSQKRDFLISPTGNKVFVKDIGENTIGLYFGANWYSPCENFTPVLASVYHHLKENCSNFEVVFVSSDEDQASFEQFHGKMPWPTIPFSDLQSKRSLTQRYQIEAIPSLIILDSSGELIRTDGVELVYRYGWRAFPFTMERITELEDEERAKHACQTLQNLLLADGRDYVIGHDQQVRVANSDAKFEQARELQVPVSSLVGKTIGLYFSAYWCPPCEKFTSRLISTYNMIQEKDQEFEFVFVSMDRDKEGYSQCFSSMPWLALPYDGKFSKALSRYFDVKGIPTLVIIGPDGKTVTREGRNLINLHLDMAYPFTDAQVVSLHEKMDEEAKSFPDSFNHVGHHHVLRLVSENTGGGPFICCECEEQGLRWAYQCLGCGYEVHLKCVRDAKGEGALDSLCAISGSGTLERVEDRLHGEL